MKILKKQGKIPKTDYRSDREFLKNRQLLTAAFEKEIQVCLARNNPEEIINCLGAAAYYKVPEAQLFMGRYLLTAGSPMVEAEIKDYLLTAAYSGLPEAQAFLAECYRSGYMFPKNENLADQLDGMARVGFESRNPDSKNGLRFGK